MTNPHAGEGFAEVCCVCVCKEGKKRVEIQMFRRGMSASRLEKPAELYLGRISSEEPKKARTEQLEFWSLLHVLPSLASACLPQVPEAS